MGFERVIAHSDADAFYASVECMLEPRLRGRPMAVCGSVENRHGIILAKSQEAKLSGVKTGMCAWEAKQACRGITLVPPNYEQYVKYSRMLRLIYERFTDTIESYGMDEVWLDLTGSTALFGNGENIARTIQRSVWDELGLSVSVGVAHNKTLAKLASDMHKPKGITILRPDNWQEQVWPLPVSDLLFVGRATTRKLIGRGIYTIGDLASLPIATLISWFGKNGGMLWLFANGKDNARVMPCGYEAPIKSVGHGITCFADLKCEEQVWPVMLDLSQDIGKRLRFHNVDAYGVESCIRGNDLEFKISQGRLPFPTQSPLVIARRAFHLLKSEYRMSKPVRSVTVRAISLKPHMENIQLDVWGGALAQWRRERFEDAVYEIREKYGDSSMMPCALLQDRPMPEDGREMVRMPGLYFNK